MRVHGQFAVEGREGALGAVFAVTQAAGEADRRRVGITHPVGMGDLAGIVPVTAQGDRVQDGRLACGALR